MIRQEKLITGQRQLAEASGSPQQPATARSSPQLPAAARNCPQQHAVASGSPQQQTEKCHLSIKISIFLKYAIFLMRVKYKILAICAWFYMRYTQLVR